MKFIQLLLIFSLGMIISCNNPTPAEESTAPEPQTPGDWKSMNATEYSIQYPDSFEVNESGQMGMSFILLSPLTSAGDIFRENIGLITEELTGKNIDLDAYSEISTGQIKSMITDADILVNERHSIGDFDCQKVIYSGRQGQYSLKWQQYYLIVNEKAYVLTFTSELDQFDKYVDVATQVMDSFRVNRKA